jgi:excisionase family DNA binding protein
MLPHVDLLKAKRLADAAIATLPRASKDQWVSYDRILQTVERRAGTRKPFLVGMGSGPSLGQSHLEQLCREALDSGNGSVFWPALALAGRIYAKHPTKPQPAGFLGFLVMVTAINMGWIPKGLDFVTTEQAALRLSVSPRHIRRLIAEGRIKARLTDSGHWEIDRESVEDLQKESQK